MNRCLFVATKSGSAVLLGGLTLALAACVPTLRRATPEPALVGRPAAEALTYPPLRFDPPDPLQLELANGIRVFLIEDHSLPLVDVFARFRGGSANFERSFLAATSAVPALLRNGGTRRLSPDSVDALIEFYSLSMSFGSGGQSSFASVNSLQRHLDLALALWADMLRNPRFDSVQVEVWRGRELDGVRRRADDPMSLAISRFNYVMYGDHPVGWIMDASDLEPEDLSRERLNRVHREIFCRDNLILGVTGAITPDEARTKLEQAFRDLPACPREFTPTEAPRIRREPGVFLIPKELNQSTVIMGHPGTIRQEDSPEYFASRVADAILGGSGFTSRILSRVRSQEGYAYSASSLWTAPRRYEGIFGATTQTKTSSTVAAIRLIREIMEEMRAEPPTPDEVRVIVDDVVNGFVFNFEDPAQIVSRRMTYVAGELPLDWLERSLAGTQRVTPVDVLDVMRRYVRPDSLIIVVVGDSTQFDEPLTTLGPVTILEPPNR